MHGLAPIRALKLSFYKKSVSLKKNSKLSLISISFKMKFKFRAEIRKANLVFSQVLLRYWQVFLYFCSQILVKFQSYGQSLFGKKVC